MSRMLLDNGQDGPRCQYCGAALMRFFKSLICPNRACRRAHGKRAAA